MDPSLWRHATVQQNVNRAASMSPLEVFVLGMAVGVLIVIMAACFHKSESRGSGTGGRRAFVTGWADLFLLVGAVARGALLLVVALLLLGRVLFWPTGRRW
jgi:hypothetical protein